MKKKIADPFKISDKEKEILLELLDAYRENKKEEIDNLHLLTIYGQAAGAIAQTGDLYTFNLNVFKIQDKAREYLEKQRTDASQLIKKLLNNL